ncbi:hypothetical protein ACOMHN_041518 [Nucella lapillus]
MQPIRRGSGSRVRVQPSCTWSEASIAERERMYGMKFANASLHGLLLPPGYDSSSWGSLLEQHLFYVYCYG